MLAWEKSGLTYDLGDLFGVNQKYYNYDYSDITIYNQSVRAILDEEENIIFAYAFVNKNLIFFTDVRALKTLINGFKNQVKY